MNGLEVHRKELLSLYPSWSEMTLYRRFEMTAKDCQGKMFLIDGSRRYSYGEMKQLVDRAAEALKLLGVKMGDCVAVMMSNRLEFIYLTFAIAKLGAVKVPVNRSAGFDEVRYILSQTESHIMILEDTKQWEKLNSLCMEHHFIGLDLLPQEELEKLVSWQKIFCQEMPEQEEASVDDAQAVSDIIYTSGSTGQPKGVMLTHDMLLRSAFANCMNRGFERGRRLYVPLPLFHVYGYVEGLLAVLFVGGSIVISHGKFDAEQAVKTMEESQANDILSVPTIMMKILLLPSLDNYNLNALQAVYCSASVCPKWVWSGIRTRLKVSEITTGYGMTEVSGASMQTDPLDSDEVQSGRVGKILDGGCAGIQTKENQIIEYRVLDQETGLDLPDAIYGELVCRGPIVMKGYYKNPEANAHTFTKDGWMKTGDIGYRDAAGYYKYLGRCNDMYKVNGENVSPQFLDKVISKCEDVISVESVGVPNERFGWIGVAFVDADNPNKEKQKRIVGFCKERLAPYQMPKYFFFLNGSELPHTSTGKVQKFKLRKLAEEMISKQEVNEITKYEVNI